MDPIHSPLMALALALAGCTTTNPPYDAGVDAVSPDGATVCDPTECPSGRCEQGRCVLACTDASACRPGETCCDDFCTDLTDDPRNCGACGTVCGPHQECRSATCSASVL